VFFSEIHQFYHEGLQTRSNDQLALILAYFSSIFFCFDSVRMTKLLPHILAELENSDVGKQ